MAAFHGVLMHLVSLALSLIILLGLFDLAL